MKKKPKSYWNYRILLEYRDTLEVINGSLRPTKYPALFLAEVLYVDDIPHSWGSVRTEYSSKKSVKQTLKHQLAATRQPVLYAGDRFPEEVKLREICINY